MKKAVFLLLCLIIAFRFSISQQQSLAEKLGYTLDARLLIIHADDAGVSHSTNRAVIKAFEMGRINSCAIMVPCPWFPEIAAYAISNPQFDYGLHLTFTSEWNTYKWRGVASSDNIPSLLDKHGYFYASTSEAVSHAKPDEVETEFRAQIEMAIAMGIEPTHFDSHMLTAFGNEELIGVFLKLGEEYQIPLLITKDYLQSLDKNTPLNFEKQVFVDYVCETPVDVKPENWNAYYSQVLSSLKPGLNELILHLAYDDDETRAMTSGHKYYESAWRQRDFDFMMSDEFEALLKTNSIQLVTWKQIRAVMYPR